MIYISRAAHFSASHKLYNPKWSPEQNREIFGKCANGHGHNFNLTVTVKGEPDAESGFVINFKDLKKIINEEILDKVDHKDLDTDVEFLKNKLSTCEVMSRTFWEILAPKIDQFTKGKVKLHCIRLQETPNNYAEYFGT
jgi:6-pyruvoyltetrahydropterin/6-carboxytetrahydropterin synthase